MGLEFAGRGGEPLSPAWSSTRPRSIPEVGQSFTFHGFSLSGVLRRSRNRIKRHSASSPLRAQAGSEGRMNALKRVPR